MPKVGGLEHADLMAMTPESLAAFKEAHPSFGVTTLYRFYINHEGVIRQIGYEQADGQVIALNRLGIMVVKWPGQSYWSGRGERGYARSHVTVYQIERSDPEHAEVRAREIIDFENASGRPK